MNYRLILAAGVMTSLIGATVGWGMGQIALRRQSSQVQTYVSQGYQELYGRRFLWLGAITGGLIGMGQAAVLQFKRAEDREKS
jgi:hypothetical protein